MRSKMGQGRIFSKPSEGLESVGKFAGDTGQGTDEGLQSSTCKRFSSQQPLPEKAHSPPSISTTQIHGVLPNSKDKHHAEHKTHQQTPSERATPGACPGLASAPSAGPRVNKNHQMERKLFFHGGKRLPFQDLQ